MDTKMTLIIGKTKIPVITYFFEDSGMCNTFYNPGSGIGVNTSTSNCTHLHVNVQSKVAYMNVRTKLNSLFDLRKSIKDYDLEDGVFSFRNFKARLVVDNRNAKVGQSGTYDMEVEIMEFFVADEDNLYRLKLTLKKLSVFEVSAWLEKN